METIGELTAYAAKWKNIRDTTKERWDKATSSIASIPLKEFSRDDAIEYRINRPDNISPGTWKSYIDTLHSIWNVGILTNKLETNVWKGLSKDLPKAKAHYTFRPYEFWEAMHGDPFFMGLYLHGMRLNEFCGIEQEDIITDTEYPYFNLRHTKKRLLKNDPSIRELPIHNEWLKYSKDFVAGSVLDSTWTTRIKTRTGCNSHQLRHCFRKRMLNARIEWSIQKALLGHGSPGVTGGYGEILLEDKWKAMQEIPL